MENLFDKSEGGRRNRRDRVATQRSPCPECGAPTSRVTDTRASKAGFQRRRRQCPHCGHRWWTMELPEAVIAEFPHFVAALYEADHTIKTLISQVTEISGKIPKIG